ncbi:thioesterase II family protein [Nocardia inohanensis]|uniref:thioesterase II family protein n=1 Tax=Nocardia inohanensis TaxID=209246 RepID=UPI00082D9BE4|nr:alpha/beta fold hydrolase [Nocardia inohanensis]
MIDSDNALWFRRYSPSEDARCRLLCFPHAGGAATFFAPFARELAPDIDAVAVQYPGRQERYREPLVAELAALVDGICGAMGRSTGVPTAFFGHSMGAIVAYEVAKQLDPLSADYPVALFASGRRGPSTYRDERVDTLPDSEIRRELLLLGGTGRVLLDDPDMAEAITRVFRNDYRAIGGYQDTEGPHLHCPVVALTGDDDPYASPAEVRAWRNHTRSDFTMHSFPGGHFYLADQVSEISDIIRGELPPRRSQGNERNVVAGSNC